VTDVLVTKLACSELSLRSSHIGEFWNTTLRPKAWGFKPSNVFVTNYS